MLADMAVEIALETGASEAEAYIQSTLNRQVDFTDTDKKIMTNRSTGMGLRVAIGKRVGMHSTSNLIKDGLQKAVDRAVGIARGAPEDSDWSGFNDRLGRSRVNGIYDSSIRCLTYDELVDRIDLALDVLRGYSPKVKPSMGSVALMDSDVTLANSNGESMERRETMVATYFYAKARDGDRESTGYEFEQSRFYGDTNFDNLALRAAEKAVDFLDANQVVGGEMPVVIRNKVFASILGVMIAPPINADVVQKGASPLEGKLGTKISHEGVTVVDDGVMKGGLASSPFDDEGYPRQKTPIISHGILENFIYDTYTAGKAGMDSTGNASRNGYASPPSPSTSNLVLKEGNSSPEEMIHETRRGLHVETTIGEWLSNPVSGELNATVTQGYLIEDGELTQPVKGLVLAGNWYEMLRGGLEMIGKDTEKDGSNYSPTVMALGLTVSGK